MTRRTKIVATLGPASRDEDVLERLIAAGADVVRLNLSHGERREHAQTIARVRAVSDRLGVTVGVMIDLPGPKLRLGDLPGPLELKLGERVLVGAGTTLPLNYPELLGHLREGQRVLLDDGAIALLVLGVESAGASSLRAVLRVVSGGIVTSRNGVNLPDTVLPVPALTAVDEAWVAFGLAHDVDFVAQSFVRRAADVLCLRELIAAGGGDQMVVAKIERREALAELGDIVEAADAIMVARGDLGAEIESAEVPIWQKRIIRAAVRAGRPVITATQMLQSMVADPRPTRAEVSDVANAMYDSTCAVMLSGETAAGAYPVESVATMAHIAETVEPDIEDGGRALQRWDPVQEDVSGAISYGAYDVARKVGAAAIVTATASGATARAVAKYRPAQPIIALSPSARVVRQLGLAWGVTPLLVRSGGSVDDLVVEGVARALSVGIVHAGDIVVITAGAYIQPGTADLIQVRVV
jgi:pyruvate kinase